MFSVYTHKQRSRHCHLRNHFHHHQNFCNCFVRFQGQIQKVQPDFTPQFGLVLKRRSFPVAEVAFETDVRHKPTRLQMCRPNCGAPSRLNLSASVLFEQ